MLSSGLVEKKAPRCLTQVWSRKEFLLNIIIKNIKLFQFFRHPNNIMTEVGRMHEAAKHFIF